MKRPEEFIQICEKQDNIITLEDAIEFKNDMVSKYGNEAKDNDRYIISYSYVDEDVCIVFETVLPNLNYKKEVEEWEKTCKVIAEETITNREKKITELHQKIIEYTDILKNNQFDSKKVKHYTEQIKLCNEKLNRLQAAQMKVE